MKIAISSTGPDLDSEVDPRFGRCQYFLILDLDDMNFEAVPNANVAAGSGAGIQSAKVVADKGTKVVLTGRVGPNAYQVLSEAGLDIITDVSGPVRRAVQQYENGQLQRAERSNAANHSGLQPDPGQGQGPWLQKAPEAGFGMGRGGGDGRGMGRGGGMGGGRCRTAGRGMGVVGGTKRGVYGHPPVPPATALTTEEELNSLKQDARMLQQQMEEMQKRIKKLEKEKSLKAD
jgi:predicted Fe-Mo cluster-binding NifX family protein